MLCSALGVELVVRAWSRYVLLSVLLLGGHALECAPAQAGAFGGALTLTSDYIFRGVSQGNGDPAAQADVHYTTATSTFFGAFASTLNRVRGYGYEGEVDAYLGQRFDLDPAWSLTFGGVSYWYLGSNLPVANDYQEVSAAVSYLDQWSFSVAVSPNWPAYDYRYRVGRYPSYVANLEGQLPLPAHFLATAGLGYTSVTEGNHYFYGNAGVAFLYERWRLDAGYYLTQGRAASLYPYGRAVNRLAATISWHF